MKNLSIALSLAIIVSLSGQAAQNNNLQSPERGVLCDRYMCASGTEGISQALTEKYLGKKVAASLFAQGDFDRTEFTFSNGIFCDTKEQLCRGDRYYGADGKRSGTSSDKYTKLLFGHPGN
ncbi:YcgJ family protein [Enterobacter pseudoroggenkampii]|uniref:YcgJ family protein n=1 Tax=Enterobacter pseudoroggenkampii TaxID=2996112 RepID=A0ABT3X9Q7_9ENTR|nr:YcgJ family protein [Enterobacter pseudoroggenkampii]